jgi:hypothetical protein
VTSDWPSDITVTTLFGEFVQIVTCAHLLDWL